MWLSAKRWMPGIDAAVHDCPGQIRTGDLEKISHRVGFDRWARFPDADAGGAVPTDQMHRRHFNVNKPQVFGENSQQGTYDSLEIVLTRRRIAVLPFRGRPHLRAGRLGSLMSERNGSGHGDSPEQAGWEL